MVVRTAELKTLEQIYESEGNSITLVYGSVRSEKEQIIGELCQGKQVFYYHARFASPREQLKQFANQIQSTYNCKITEPSYDACFKRITCDGSSKLIVVIDNFDLVCRKNPEFLDGLLKLKNRSFYPGPIMILLASEALSWCNNDLDDVLSEADITLDYKVKLKDVSFLDIVRTFPSFSVKQSVEAYGILGGVPAYLNLWDAKKSTKENVCALILSKYDGALFNEAEQFIGSELRELQVYETILSSIARGNEKLNDLYLDTGYSRAKISVYIKNLAAFDVVSKVVSFETGGWENTKKGIYRIKNNFVNFYFKFIYPHLSEVYVLEPEVFYDRYIADYLDAYLNRYFVLVCQEYLELMNRMHKVPIQVKKMGTWIGKLHDIDIVGQDEARNTIVGMCNYTEDEMSYDIYSNLLATMELARVSASTIYLFSAKSFDKKLLELAKQDSKVVLVDMTEL